MEHPKLRHLVMLTPLLLLLGLLVAGHVSNPLEAQTKTHPAASTTQQLDREIADLRQEISSLKTQVSALESRVSLSEYTLTNKQDRQDQITLDLADKTYQRLDSDTGFFLVRVEDATPHLDGYKLHLRIGNPSNAIYAGYKLRVQWNRAYDFAKYTAASYTEWQKSIQQREVSSTDKLDPGVWNAVEVILPSTNSSQLGFVTLSISTDALSLREQ